MERTLSFKASSETVAWVDSHPGGRSAFLRQLIERARLDELATRDLAILQADGGNVSDVEPTIDPEEWASAAAEWEGVDL